MAAFVAGIGGAMYAVPRDAVPTNYTSLLGLVWLATLVTLGIRSNVAVVIRGIVRTPSSPEWRRPTFPRSLSEDTTPILFGLGAVGVARVPQRSDDRERTPDPVGVGQGAWGVADLNQVAAAGTQEAVVVGGDLV